MAKQYVNLSIGQRGGAVQRFKLDGRIYGLTVSWDPLESVWRLTIADAAGVKLRAGLVLRHGEDVLEPFGGPEFPGAGAGKLRVWDVSGAQSDPGRDDLKRGSAVRLVYIPAAEVN